MPRSDRFLLAAALVCLGCQSRPGPMHTMIGWRPVTTFSGHGDVQTDSFNIESGQWRIKWKTAKEQPPGQGAFKVIVESAISGRTLMVAVDRRGVGHDVAVVTEDPRLYQLVVESQAVDWSMSIEESVVGYSR